MKIEDQFNGRFNDRVGCFPVVVAIVATIGVLLLMILSYPKSEKMDTGNAPNLSQSVTHTPPQEEVVSVYKKGGEKSEDKNETARVLGELGYNGVAPITVKAPIKSR